MGQDHLLGKTVQWEDNHPALPASYGTLSNSKLSRNASNSQGCYEISRIDKYAFKMATN